jgi:hypothetical protein
MEKEQMPRYRLGRMRRGPASETAAGGEAVSSHISDGSKGYRSVPVWQEGYPKHAATAAADPTH